LRREQEKWEALATIAFVNRGTASERSGVHLHSQGWKWSGGNVFLHYPLSFPTHPPTELCPQPNSSCLPSCRLLRGEGGKLPEFLLFAYNTHLCTPKDKVLLANEKQNFSSLAPFSPLTVPSQKSMENAAATGTLQANKLKDFSTAKCSRLAAPQPFYRNLKLLSLRSRLVGLCMDILQGP